MINYRTDENNIIISPVDKSQKVALEGYKQTNKNICVGMIDNLDNTFSNPVIEPTQEDINKHIETLVQGHLDQSAEDWGYDSILHAVSYIGDPDITYNKEGVMFRNWRSAVWVYVNAERVKFEQGLRTIPSDADLIVELPLLSNYQ